MYHVLIALSAIKPINDKDIFTLGRINKSSRFVTTDGFQFNIDSDSIFRLMRLFNARAEKINPFTNEKFKLFDCDNLQLYFIQNILFPQIGWKTKIALIRAAAGEEHDKNLLLGIVRDWINQYEKNRSSRSHEHGDDAISSLSSSSEKDDKSTQGFRRR